MPELTIAVQELHVGVHDVSRLDGLTRLECLVDGLARLEILNANTIKSLALAGFYEFILDNDVGVPIEEDTQSRFELTGAVIGHKIARPSSGEALSYKKQLIFPP